MRDKLVGALVALICASGCVNHANSQREALIIIDRYNRQHTVNAQEREAKIREEKEKERERLLNERRTEYMKEMCRKALYGF